MIGTNSSLLFLLMAWIFMCAKYFHGEMALPMKAIFLGLPVYNIVDTETPISALSLAGEARAGLIWVDFTFLISQEAPTH